MLGTESQSEPEPGATHQHRLLTFMCNRLNFGSDVAAVLAAAAAAADEHENDVAIWTSVCS